MLQSVNFSRLCFVIVLLLSLGCDGADDRRSDGGDRQGSDTSSDVGELDTDSRFGSDGDADGDSDTDADGDSDSDSDNPFSPDTDNVITVPIAKTMPRSYNPPGGLRVDQTPMFIVLGFDDNRYTDGMKWVLDTLSSRRNPDGIGNDATFDRHNLKVSFYFTTNALAEGGEALLEQWRRAVSAGHEVGNHTHTHRYNENERPFDWHEELTTCNDVLTEKLGVPRSSIVGVRAPYLDFHFPPLFTTLAAGVDSIVYDCSVRHDPYGDNPENWTFYRHIWPYTLENGLDMYTAGGFAIGNPAIWEVPAYSLPRNPDRDSMRQPSNMYTGFDSTAYGTLNLAPSDFHNSMVWALDLRMAEGDNRAPLTIGLHSDTYSSSNTGYSQPLDARRAALADFIDYALATYPQVRFVSTVQLLMWMSEPTPLP